MYRYLRVLLNLVLVLAGSSAFAQSPAVKGRILYGEGEVLQAATVVVYSASDSVLVTGASTDAEGRFTIENLDPGEYRIQASFVGFGSKDTEPFTLADGLVHDTGDILLILDTLTMEGVSVEAERKLIEVQPDKTVLNVQGTINATGSSALELLRKSPGVVVDNNDNIILAGKNGVKIYIDGKPSPLSTEDLAAQLRTTQSTEIDAIEIITNPSAKYEAEGNAGIINIRMRRDRSLGFNNTLDLSYRVGANAHYGANSTFNYRTRRQNTFGSYAFGAGESDSYINLYRIQNGVLFDERATTRRDGPSNRLRIGTDVFLGEKTIVGALVTGSVSDRNWYNQSLVPITNLSKNEVESVLDAVSDNDGVRRNVTSNLNYRFDNRKGVTSNADLDIGLYQNDNASFQPNYYRTPLSDTPIEENIFSSQAPTDINIYSGKFDHERTAAGGKLSVGSKVSRVTTDNAYSFYRIEEGVETLDVDRSNDFLFTETIAAGYVSFSTTLRGLEINTGVRAEYTDSKGELTAFKPIDNNTVARSYLDIFPSAGVSYNLAAKHQVRLNYSKRIDRPSYQSLNPFEFKLSELSFRRGNPFLQPQYTHSVSLGHTYNYVLNTTLTYSHTNDFFANISDSTDISRTVLKTLNMDFQRVISGSVSYPYQLASWWSTYSSGTAFNKKNRAEFDDGRIVDVNATVASLYHQSSFSLPRDWALEISGWYSSPSIWGAVYRTDANYSIDTGFSKKLLQGRANLKVAVTDIFKTAPWSAIQDFSGLFVDASGGWESRQLRVNFSYQFGNSQVKKSRKRKTGLEDEANRVD